MQVQMPDDEQSTRWDLIIYSGLVILCGILMQIRTDFSTWKWWYWIFLWPFALFEYFLGDLVSIIGIIAIVLGVVLVIIVALPKNNEKPTIYIEEQKINWG